MTLLHESSSAGNAVCYVCVWHCVQQRPFRNGDHVLISDNLVQVMSLQEGHGGWIPDMQNVRTIVGSFMICLSCLYHHGKTQKDVCMCVFDLVKIQRHVVVINMLS